MHVVFGHVVSGQDLVRQLEQLPVDRNSRPLQDAMVSNCGELVRQVKGKTQRNGGFVHDFTDNQLGWFLCFVFIFDPNCAAKKEKKSKKQVVASSDDDSSDTSRKRKKDKKKKRGKDTSPRGKRSA